MPAKFLRKAAAAVKDKHSIYLSRIRNRKGFRNPYLEAAIIKATSHDESAVDYKNAQRVFTWVRTSPYYLRPFIWAITKRMEKTRSWVVALKGLMLLHGVYTIKIPAIMKIGRLPFDLSNFHDRSSHPTLSWGFSSFVKAYFAFVDQRSVFLNCSDGEKAENSMQADLLELERLQILLDLLMQIRPYGDGMEVPLVREAMNCVVIEIFDVYSVICNGIASVLARIFGVGNEEATMTLRILEKSSLQSEQLSSYFDVCRVLGVLNANELPPVEQIPEEDIRDLERLICGVSGKECLSLSYADDMEESEKRLVEETKIQDSMKTIITQNWMVFNDDHKGLDGWKGNGFDGYKASWSGGIALPANEQSNRARPDYQRDLICLF